ncbi:MAG TPA: DUF6283 family protein [Aldersonia sp.]
MGDDIIGAPAPRPCATCPYRVDVPSGVWAADQYEKLRRYDTDTAMQPHALFLCHQTDADSSHRRLCAGWVGCHGDQLLALRLAGLDGRLTPATIQAAVDYVSPVPLFETGAAAARHGQAEIDHPSRSATAAIRKISRRRTDLQFESALSPRRNVHVD